MNINLYLYSYISPKGTYRELKYFIKPFTMLESFSNVQNSYQKFYKKFNFTCLDRLRVPFDWLNALFDQSNKNRAPIKPGRDSRTILLITSINWGKTSTVPKYWISNFTSKIPELEFSLYKLYETIFSKLEYHYYNLFMYIPIYTTLMNS